MKLEGIEKVVKVLGAEGSLLVENIKKVLAAPQGSTLVVDEEGNVKLN